MRLYSITSSTAASNFGEMSRHRSVQATANYYADFAGAYFPVNCGDIVGSFLR